MTEEDYQLRIHELEKEISKLRIEIKRNSDTTYGLRWMDVPEASNGEDHIPILEEVKDKAIVQHDGQPTHILIEGDNYHALTCLNYTHKGKIDVIYIDPPYNTGSDGFVYKDKRVLDKFPDGTPVPTDHPLRHSYWLSFMEKRLRLAKNLLSDKGVIFISIDDNEQANLKLLCDQVFGESNFISNIIWRKQGGGKSDSKYLANNCEYILCYKRSTLDRFLGAGIDESIYNKVDESGRKYRLMSLDFGSLSYSQSLDYPITLPNGIICYPDCEDSYRKRQNGFYNHHDWCWRVSPLEYERRLNAGKIEFTYNKKSDKWKVQERLYLDEKDEGGLYGNLITDFTNRLAKNQLKEIFKDVVFNYPKPIELLTFFLKLYPSHNAIILDFFAGSGTTMHATMALNAEDGGHRQCILVQQQEDSKICEKVTYERNKRVMCGYTNSKGQYVDGLGGSLKYYRTDFVGEHCHLNATDNDRIALSQKAGNLLALAENTLQELTATNRYQIFQEKDGDIATNGCMFTAVYFSDDLDKFGEFVQQIEQLQIENDYPHITIYLFCWDTPENYKEEFNNLRGLTLKAIPQPILDIYRRINN